MPVLPYLGLHCDAITRRLKFCVNKFHGFVNLRVIFQNTRRIMSFFPYKDRFNRSQKSKIVYKASRWDCDAFYIGKTKRRIRDRKTEHFKALTLVGHASAVAGHSIGPLHDPVTWYGINYTGTQITQWDFQNKGTRTSPARLSFVLEVLLRNLRPSVIYSAPCDRIVQRAYSTGHNIEWDHFEILANGQCDLQCKIKKR